MGAACLARQAKAKQLDQEAWHMVVTALQDIKFITALCYLFLVQYVFVHNKISFASFLNDL